MRALMSSWLLPGLVLACSVSVTACGSSSADSPYESVSGVDASTDVADASVDQSVADGTADSSSDVAVTDAPADAGLDTTSDTLSETGTDAGTGTLFPYAKPSAATANGWLSSPPSCTEEDLLRKYFVYRARLLGNGTAAYPGFVSQGTSPGESLLASSRDATAHCENDWWLNDASCQRISDDKADGKYVWGDTTIWQGHYLAFLATEHAVFRDMGVDVTSTERDLALALKAFDRLDLAGEAAYGVAPSLDGFFVRTDTPANFIYKADHSYRFPRADDGLLGYGCVKSGPACAHQSIDDGFYVSQDQVVGMLLGLGFVVRLVPAGTVVDGYDVVEQSLDAVHRMIRHLRDNGWKVTDPTGHHPPDAWGGNAIGTSYELAAAANVIVQGNRGISNYQDSKSQTQGAAAFTGVDLSWNVQTDVNKSMAIKLVAMTGDWDQDKYDERALGWYSQLMPYTYAFFQGKSGPSARSADWEMESILSRAPCVGPCHNTPGCPNAPGWRGENRWTSPEARNGDRNYPVKEMNGVDYLLAYNLYYLHRHGQLQFELPTPPSSGCSSPSALSRILDEGPTYGEVYDPRDPCNAADMSRRFCGRTWARWLEAARTGEATIVTAGARWQCHDDGTCKLVENSSPGQGSSGSDLILGTSGDDTLYGVEGQDCMYGLGGNDHLVGGDGRDELHGGPGNDQLDGDGQGSSEGEGDIIFGEDGDDKLNGALGEDTLVGGPGDDELHGGPGDDYLGGGVDNDVLWGDDGDDYLEGGDGNDELHGGANRDAVYGGPGRDKLAGDGGNDDMRGEDGDDFMAGGDGDDVLWGGSGEDRLCGGDGNDHLSGGPGGDSCRSYDSGSPSSADHVDWCADEATLAQCSLSAFDSW